MNWIILILSGLMEVAFTFCLGKTKPATFRRIFLITTLILSIIGLKVLG